MSTEHGWSSFTATILGICLIVGTVDVASAQREKPNILVIWGDDIGTWNSETDGFFQSY